MNTRNNRKINLILTGFMGTGKSCVGRELAEKLGMDFVDIDTLIEENAGMRVPEIFSRFGEPHFRKMEREAVRSLVGCNNKVIATGGGTITNPENLQNLKKIGPVICLTATPETVYERTRAETHRPLLQVPDPISRIRQLLKKRESHYAQADHHLPTDGETIDGLVKKILTVMDLKYSN